MPVKKIFSVIRANTSTVSQGLYDLPQDIPLGNDVLVKTTSFNPDLDMVDSDVPVGNGGPLLMLGWNTEVDGGGTPPIVFTLPVPTGRSITPSSVTVTAVGPVVDTDDGAGGWTNGTGTINYSTGACSITFAGSPGTGDVIVDYSIDAP